MQTKPEFRRGERVRHEYIITIWEDLTLSPNYAVALNLNETGLHFKSLFEMVPGTPIWILMNDSISRQKMVPARVVWCKGLDNSAAFRYGGGVEFLQAQTEPDLKPSGPIASHIEAAGKKRGGVVIQMSKRSPE